MTEHVRKLNRAIGAIQAAMVTAMGLPCEEAVAEITHAARASITVIADVRDDLEAAEVVEPDDGTGRPFGW